VKFIEEIIEVLKERDQNRFTLERTTKCKNIKLFSQVITRLVVALVSVPIPFVAKHPMIPACSRARCKLISLVTTHIPVTLLAEVSVILVVIATPSFFQVTVGRG